MTNRFERLFQITEKQYTIGSPVIIAAGALLKDAESGSIITQLKFQSVSEKRIKAVKVSLSAFDVSGKRLQGISDYQYLELDIANGQNFGSNKAIVMPINVTRSVSVESVIVVFADNSVWESSAPFSALPSPKNLSQYLLKTELEKQYRLSTSEQAAYYPCEDNDLWQCSCGTWNSGITCTHCHICKAQTFGALNIETLTEQMNIRLAKEQEQREKEAARQAQFQAEADAKRKTRKKRAKIVAIIVGILAILIGGTFAVYTKIHELTIEKLLALKTQNDVVDWLGEPDDIARYHSYDGVKFMGEKYSMLIDFEETSLDHWTLSYSYPGMKRINNALEMIEYEPTTNDQNAAKRVVSDVLSSFTEKYGVPEIFNSDVDTTTYTWVVKDRMIELCDYTDNEDLSVVCAVDIRVNCDHQSFCKHTDIKTETAEATCTEDGYARKICTICGYVDEAIKDAFGHSNTATVINEATCLEKGLQVLNCSVCKNEDEVPISELGHEYKDSITKQATCEKDGVRTYTCMRCNDSYTETIKAVGHSMTPETCTKPETCSNCGKTGAAATGHKWEYKFWVSNDTGNSYCRCVYCKTDYKYNIKIVCNDLPYRIPFEDTVIESIYLDKDQSSAFIDDNGKILISAEIHFVASGPRTDVYYEIYNSSGDLIQSWWADVSNESYDYIYAHLQDNDTYYIKFK